MIGLDEIALKRGHRDVVVLMAVALEGGGVESLVVLAKRQKETVAAFRRAMPEHLRRTIERACTAMYEGFVRASEAQVPWAEIVIDRFHVARAYRDGADTGRKQALKRLKSALPTAEYTGLDEITNDFQGRQTSGFVAGFNNRVKMLKRRCYGMFDVGKLFQRLTLDWHGYQLFGHT